MSSSSRGTGGTPLEFSDIEGDVEEIPSVSVQPDPEESSHWTCRKCSKTLKTRAGYRKHCLLHEMKSLDDLLYSQLQPYLSPAMEEVVQKIAEEPSPSQDDFKSLNKEVLQCVDTYSFSNFIIETSAVIVDIIRDRQNVLLGRFVESCQCQFYAYLASEENFGSLRTHILFMLSEKQATFADEVVNLYLFRLLSLYFDKCMATVLLLLREGLVQPSSNAPSVELSETEKSALLRKCSGILISMLEAGMKTRSNIWKTRSKALCHNFAQQSSSSVSVKDFINRVLWDITDEEDDRKVSLSETAIQFFLNLEGAIKKLMSQGKSALPANVWECLGQPGNVILLELMCSLTRGFLSEEDTLDFFYDIVKCFSFLSVNLEAKAIRADYDSRGNLNVVALRTNLKRNPKSKTSARK